MEPHEVKRYLNKAVAASDGIRYKFTGATIRRDGGGAYWYQAELQDLRAERSVRICRLEDVAVLEEPPTEK